MAFDSIERSLKGYIYYDNTYISSSSLTNEIKVSELSASNNTLKPGEFCRNKIEFEYITPSGGKLELEGKKIRFTIDDLDNSTIPLAPSETPSISGSPGICW